MPDAGETQVPEDTGDDLGFDAPEDSAAAFATTGKPIRSLLRLPTALVKEAKLNVDPDGLSITAVDPANVGMIDLTVHADGFSGFQVNRDVTVGVNFKTLTSALSFARMPDDDPVRIDILDPGGDVPRMRVAVIRPDQQMKRVTVFSLIDPDAVRDEPDVPGIDLPFRATPGIDALNDAVKSLTDGHDHAGVAIDGSALVIGSTMSSDVQLTDSDSDDRADTAVFPNAAWIEGAEDGDGQGSLFSLDYLRDMTKALKRSKMDRVTLKFGIEYPTMLQFNHADWNASGQFLLAPRIQSD